MQRMVLSIGFAVLLASLSGLPRVARADAISFQLSSTSRTTSSGGTVTFQGAVENETGADLNASDFFFNFANFNLASVSPIQDLGFPVDFLIPNGTTSSVVALFDVTLDTVAAGSSFTVDVQLEDSNFDLTPSQTVTVSVPGAAATPEPATLLLFGAGLSGMLWARRKGREASEV